MPILAVLAALLAAAPVVAQAPSQAHAVAACRPAPADTVAEADRKASDTAHKADMAESESVRSGNPGAARRAELARREADEAARLAADLACRPPPAGAPPKKSGQRY